MTERGSLKMAKGTKNRIRKGPLGGRPRQDGERYPNGRLKPPGPNARSVEVRQAFGLNKLNQRLVPLDVAHANGWISNEDYLTGLRFASLHRLAGFARPGGTVSSLLEVDVPTEVSLSVTLHAKSFFAGLPHAELVALWDRVFDRAERDPVESDQASVTAMLKWKAACSAMTLSERSEVTDVCVNDSFPQWLIQRSAGREGTAWERKRDLLLSGLGKVRQALRSPRAAEPYTAPQPSAQANGRAYTERTVYVDEETGAQVLEVERISRRAAA
ncbi:hypothetical protein JIP62_06980 [Brevundimonas vitis]|uniref:Uncharacterized protein n=1 Tax=Brevundimonas vitisensis TaxID=2800818 RepID=A0ABX7BQF5_9CAUL|nr:hypothetical protein [Brevundimonas vitisensis]QQQ19822.1 hypothetical protein JIP62_06980 [Brevundimonas vitisensis]